MNKLLNFSKEIDHLINLALTEDLNQIGDATSNLLFNSSEQGKATIIAKQKGIIAGLPIAQQVFKKVDSSIRISNLVNEGALVNVSNTIVEIDGSLVSILTAERTALNFLQRLSGIATLTSQFVKKVKGTRAKILDTRKTTPALRVLEKYAVRVGGGMNHRMGLFDMILIKENHIEAAGSLSEAVKRIKKNRQLKNLDLKIEVETCTLDDIKAALEVKVDRIMLDNMTLSQIQEAVELVSGRVELEVSGGVTLDTVRELAETGVDFISVGALTHSAKALDLSLLIADVGEKGK
ncbi:MAG: carboxylating nicotinate-nucleotide diphosphorylase [bacterium]